MLRVGGQKRRKHELALNKRLTDHPTACWLLIRALRTTPRNWNQHVAIGAVEDFANGAAVAAQYINGLRCNLIKCVAWQSQQRLEIGHLTETAEYIEALRLGVGRQSIGDLPPMCPIRQSIALKALGVRMTAGEAEQEPRPTHHTLIGGEYSLEEIAASGAITPLGDRLSDHCAPEGGAINDQKPLLAHRSSVGHRHKRDARDLGWLNVSLTVNRDTLTEGHQLADPPLMHAEKGEAERSHGDMRRVTLLLSHQFELSANHNQCVSLATPAPIGGDVAYQLCE